MLRPSPKIVVGPALWSAGFLPAKFQASSVITRDMSLDKLLANIKSPSSAESEQRQQLDLLAKMNDAHKKRRGEDTVLESHISTMETAYRMQIEATDAFDISKEGIESTVVDMHTIKPLDSPLLDSVSKECGCLVTAEDHSVIGGLGSAVAEWLSSNRPISLEMVGVADRFGESGDSDDLMRILGLTSAEISDAAKRSIDRRNIIP